MRSMRLMAAVGSGIKRIERMSLLALDTDSTMRCNTQYRHIHSTIASCSGMSVDANIGGLRVSMVR